MSRRLVVDLAAVFTALVASAGLPAHGGQFRGPWGAPPGVPTGGPGPAGPGPSSPTTGGRPSASDGTSWQVWWEFNKDELLPGAPGSVLGPVSGSDEFYLGPRRAIEARDATAPTAADRRDRITESLAAALRSTDNRDVVTACLVALAKVGIEPAGDHLEQLFAARLSAADQEVRETATLAFGIAGLQSAYPKLVALLRDDSLGKELAGGKDKAVPDRTRTFAAWALGLVARRHRDLAEKRAVHDQLLAHLNGREEPSRDLRVALVEALGLLAPDADSQGAAKLLQWQTVAELRQFYGLELGKGTQLVQAHAPIAIARLLGRGATAEHQRAKALFARDLAAEGRSNQIRQSAALALGTLCMPAADEPADAEFSTALLRCYRRDTDQLARYFSVLALGRIGGEQNRSHLLSIYGDASKNLEKPWVALALGLIARERARGDHGAVDDEIGRMLLRDLQAIEFDDAQSGIALAIGLCGYTEAAPTLLTMLRAGSRNDTLVGYLAVALAMLGHEAAADDLVELLQKSLRRPFVLQQCALALGRLGDARAVPALLDLLNSSQSTAALSAVATALATIRDRRSIDPLIAALRDDTRTALARAFAAAALGGIGDKDALPWNAAIARDMNYMAAVDTLTNGATGVLDIL